MKRQSYSPNEKINGLIYLNEAEPHIRENGTLDRKAIFQCECGNQFTAFIYSVKRGQTNSCGCLAKKLTSKRFSKHGYSKSPIYNVWKNMKQRCYQKNSFAFQHYGGRGISICEEWLNNPANFVKWSFENGYKQGLEIDRINNNGNYEPSNCRFVTIKENSRNRRTTKIGFNEIQQIQRIKFLNPKITSVEIAKNYKVNPVTIRKILKSISMN